MSEYTLPEALAFDDSVLARLTACTSSMTADEATRRPASGGWSVGEHLEHVTLTTEAIVGLATKLLAKLEAHPPDNAGSIQPVLRLDDLLDRAGREKYQAAESSLPTGRLPIPEALSRLEEAHRRLAALQPRFSAVSLHAISFPHRVFGPLTLGQWIAFVGVHEERHLRHIERIL
jgi:hypothetical protein